MTALRADCRPGGGVVPRTAWLLLAALLSLSVSAEAAAQQERPKQLLPSAPASPAPGGPPPSGVQPPPDLSGQPPSGAQSPTDAGPTAGLTSGPRSIKSIRVDQLPAVGIDSGGVLDERNGGLGVDMWRGTDRARIERWLPQLPAATRLPAARALMRRLLLSVATAPPRSVAAAPDESGADGAGLMGLRAERLLAMGDLQGVDDLSRDLVDRGDDARLARVRVDTLLLMSEDEEACELVRRSIRKLAGRYFQQALVFCQAREGQRREAELGLTLLREPVPDQSTVEAESDALFFELVPMVAQAAASEDKKAKGSKKKKAEAPVASLPQPSPLHLAMLRRARLPIPADALEGAGPAELAAAARSPESTREVRVEAAERAVASGALDAETLRRIYNEYRFENLDPARVMSLKDSESGPEFRAMVHQAAAEASNPAVRAQLLAMHLEKGRRDGHYLVVARTALPLLANLEPSPRLLWFAAEAARALYANERIAEGRAWFELLRSRVAPGSEGDKTVNRLWPLARLADPFAPPPAEPARLAAWWDLQREDLPPEQAERRAALLFAMLEALEEPLDDLDWRDLLQRPKTAAESMPFDAPWRALGSASAGGRKGETVLAALISLGVGGDDGTANPAVVRQALSALRRVGLVHEARAIAFDAAIAAGL